MNESDENNERLLWGRASEDARSKEYQQQPSLIFVDIKSGCSQLWSTAELPP